MVTTDSEFDQVRGKSLAWHGISRTTWDRSSDKHYTWDYDIKELGYKAQMNDITAAILSVQIGRMGELQQQRRHIAYQYNNRLRSVPIVGAQDRMDLQSWHLCVIKSDNRDQLARYLADKKIQTGVHYRPLHLHTLFARSPPLPVAEREWQRILSLPMHPGLTSREIDFVCESILEFNCAHKVSETTP